LLQGKILPSIEQIQQQETQTSQTKQPKKKKKIEKLGPVHRQKARRRKVVMASAWRGGRQDETGIKMVSVRVLGLL
jgi:hypothetical protein